MNVSSRWRRLTAWRDRHRFGAGLAAGLTAGAAVGLAVGIVTTLTVVIDRSGELPEGDLVILSGRDDSNGEQRKVLIEQWNELNPDNQARIVELSPEADSARSEMLGRAESGERIDIFNLDVTWTAEFAERGFIVPLDDTRLDTRGFLEGPLKTGSYQGKQWALPFNTDAGLLYYRKDLVGSAGSWEALRVNAERYLGTGPAGFTSQLDRYEGLTVNVLEAVRDVADRPLVNEDNEVDVDLDQLQTAVDRFRPGDGRIVLRDSLDFNEDESTRAFREGRALYLRNWPVAHRGLTEPQGDQPTAPVLQFEVQQLLNKSVLGGQNLAVARSSAVPRAAQALIEFLTDARSQQILFEHGGLAATRGVVYHDERVTERYPYAAELLTAVENAHPRPVSPCYATFSERLSAMAHDRLQNGKPLPDNAIELLDDALSRC